MFSPPMTIRLEYPTVFASVNGHPIGQFGFWFVVESLGALYTLVVLRLCCLLCSLQPRYPHFRLRSPFIAISSDIFRELYRYGVLSFFARIPTLFALEEFSLLMVKFWQVF
jgi:hypothetical protein